LVIKGFVKIDLQWIKWHESPPLKALLQTRAKGMPKDENILTIASLKQRRWAATRDIFYLDIKGFVKIDLQWIKWH